MLLSRVWNYLLVLELVGVGYKDVFGAEGVSRVVCLWLRTTATLLRYCGFLW